MRAFLLFVCFFVWIKIAQGSKPVEYYHFFHYTSEMGLPHSLVFDMIQSNDGFVWIATNNGLGRFDGYNFKAYRPKQTGDFNISGKSVNKLFLDNQNQLWLGIQGTGLNRMDIATERFYKYYPNSSEPNSVSGNQIESIFQDSDSVIWIGSNKGLDYYDKKTDKFVQCIERHDDNRNTVTQIVEDYLGRIWFKSYSQIGFFDKKTKQTHLLNELVNEPWSKSFENCEILLDEHKYLWIGSKNKGLLCYNIELNKLVFELTAVKEIGKMFINKKGDLYAVSNAPKSQLIIVPKRLQNEGKFYTIHEFTNTVNSYYITYCEDQQGNIWMSSEEGIHKIYPNNNVSVVQGKNYKDSGMLSKGIHCAFIDNMGCLWLKSERNGVLMIDLHQKQFSEYKYMENENRVMSGNNIVMVNQDSKGNIWTGCYGEGISCYNPITKVHRIIPYNQNDLSKIIFKAPSAFCEDSEGYIWIGFYDGGLLRITPSSLKIEYFFGHKPDQNDNLGCHAIRSIILDHKKNVWFIASTSGLVERNTKTGIFTYHSEKHEKDFRSNSHYRYLCQTKDGIFWTGTQNGGLGKYNSDTHEFVHYTNNPNDNSSISGNTVYYIYEASDSILWIGTDKGLNKFNRNTGKFKTYQNLINDFICAVYRIYPDNDHNLWLSGDCGILKFNLNTYQSVNYNKFDGLPSTEFNTTAGCQTHDGEIFLGSTLGLVSFYPQNIYANPYPATPRISQLKIFNKTISPGETFDNRVILDREISLVKQISLPYSLNDFTLEFSAMHFASPLKNRYWYKLDGYNKEWIETDATRRWANFTGLKPGKYNFQLKASNNDGIMNNDDGNISLIIIIEPPYSETWWFRLIMAIMLVLIALAFHRLRIRNIRKQRELLRETVHERTLELQNKNSLLEERQEEISLQNEELENHRNNLEELVLARTEEMKAALLKAEESDRLKSAFLSNMSHEIRTPMNAILGFSKLLFESDFTEEEKLKYIQIIHSNGESLLNLLNDIIDVSIIESGQLTINKREVNLTLLVSEVYSSYKVNKKLKPKSGVELQLMAPENEINVFTDAGRLKQILNNLIGNAIKFTNQGTIKISYAIESDWLKFTVSDTGIGIPQSKIDGIFNRFNKSDNSDTEVYRGGGLGLAISKSLVEALGGKIWVESEPSIGSTFHFTIHGIIT